MTEEQQTVLLIKGAISELDPSQQSKVTNLAETIRGMIRDAGDAGDLAGPLAIALVGAEMRAQS